MTLDESQSFLVFIDDAHNVTTFHRSKIKLMPDHAPRSGHTFRCVETGQINSTMVRTAHNATTTTSHSPLPRADLSVLLVVAHPDDEYYCAATVYRLTQELGAAVDQLTITNGEGGFRYALLAERIYGHALTQEEIGRARLPVIRREETLRAGRILGIRRHIFLDQPDVAFPTDLLPSIDHVWDRPFIERALDMLLQAGAYDFVFTVLPTEDTHPHHQAAALLTLEGVARLDEKKRPVVLGCAYRSSTIHPTPTFSALPQHPRMQVVSDGPMFSFDRRHKFGFKEELDYAVIVHWMMAEHKSQGLFQTAYGVDDMEDFWYFRSNEPAGLARARALAGMLNPGIASEGHARPRKAA